MDTNNAQQTNYKIINMLKQITKIAAFIIFPLVVMAQKNEQDTIRLFYLAGQSNMVGQGYNKDLPDSLKETFPNVWIFNGNTADDNQLTGGLGVWSNLKPGYGNHFSSNGKENKLSDRFGLELSFAKKLQELYPNSKIAFIKYSKGGTGLDSIAGKRFGSWESDYGAGKGINQYDHFLNTVKNALKIKDIDANGKDDLLIPSGIIWMQGEADAGASEEIALRYYSNLKRLMDLFRTNLNAKDVPIVIGKIVDSGRDDKDGMVYDYGDLVQYAQEIFVKNDGHAAIVRSTTFYNFIDAWHYTSKDYIDLGTKMAEALYKIKVKQGTDK